MNPLVWIKQQSLSVDPLQMISAHRLPDIRGSMTFNRCSSAGSLTFKPFVSDFPFEALLSLFAELHQFTASPHHQQELSKTRAWCSLLVPAAGTRHSSSPPQ